MARNAIQYESPSDVQDDNEKTVVPKVRSKEVNRPVTYLDIVEFVSSLEQKREVCSRLIMFLNQFRECDVGTTDIMHCKDAKAAMIVNQQTVNEFIDKFMMEKSEVEAALEGCNHPIKF